MLFFLLGILFVLTIKLLSFISINPVYDTLPIFVSTPSSVFKTTSNTLDDL